MDAGNILRKALFFSIGMVQLYHFLAIAKYQMTSRNHPSKCCLSIAMLLPRRADPGNAAVQGRSQAAWGVAWRCHLLDVNCGKPMVNRPNAINHAIKTNHDWGSCYIIPNQIIQQQININFGWLFLGFTTLYGIERTIGIHMEDNTPYTMFLTMARKFEHTVGQSLQESSSDIYWPWGIALNRALDVSWFLHIYPSLEIRPSPPVYLDIMINMDI